MRISNKEIELYLSDYSYELPIDNVQTFIIDPPYNIGYNYKSKVNDNLHPEDYKNMILSASVILVLALRIFPSFNKIIFNLNQYRYAFEAI